jgi:predicted TIM-barrel fold metal-dependent hydrolase
MNMKIIDAHIHIWQSGKPRGAHRQAPYSAEEVLEDMHIAGVDAAIIQPPAWDPQANQIAIDAAKQYPKHFGILGNFALNSPQPEIILRHWKEQSGMLGLRYILNEPVHREWMMGDELDWLWAGAQENGIPIAIAASSHLEIFASIAKRYPELKLIIDHLGVPLDATGEKAFLQIPALEQLAKFSNIAIKATAVPAYADDTYPYKSIEKHIQRIYQLFGAERFFWGSDITKLKCTWRQSIDLFLNEYQWISTEEKSLVMGRALTQWLSWDID